jgi:hypothetical protein
MLTFQRGGFRGNQRQGSNTQDNQQFAGTQRGRIQQRQWQGNGVRGWTGNTNVINRQQSNQSRGRGGRRGARQAPTTRGGVTFRVLRQTPLKNRQQVCLFFYISALNGVIKVTIKLEFHFY